MRTAWICGSSAERNGGGSAGCDGTGNLKKADGTLL